MGTEGRYKRERQHEYDVPPRIVVRGHLLEYRSGRAYSTPPPPQDKRRISIFSKASRLRLFKLLAALDFTKLDYPVFISLTYPDEVLPLSYVRRRQQRFLFVRSMEAYLDKQITGLWRTEWERRQSGQHKGQWCPHLHLLLWPVVWLPMSYVNEEWKRILDYGGYLRTEIKRPRNRKQVGYYVAKYMSKPSDSSLVYAAQLNTVDGRHWGKHRAKMMPLMPEECLGDVSEADARFLYDAFTRVFPDHKLPFGESFTLMGDFVPLLTKYLKQMHLTTPGETS